MFCVATAPTPASVHAQRAATAGDDEDIAIPTIPVRAQRAVIDNVIRTHPARVGRHPARKSGDCNFRPSAGYPAPQPRPGNPTGAQGPTSDRNAGRESFMTRAERFAAGSVVLGVLVLALKAAAWWLTGSAALYSDALESTVNVAGSLAALIALHLAAKPADANHPYGHDKAEFFAAVIEGVMIVVAALSIFSHAYYTWRAPTPLTTPFLGLALTALATVINGGWAAALLRAGRRLRSPALAADGRHLLGDVVSSVGIIAGVALAVTTGLLELDPLLAAATGVYVLWSGTLVIRSSVGGLMDEAPEQAVLDRVRDLVATHAQGALEAHDLRMRQAGRLTFLQFHLVVPGSMTVADSHAICDRIEEALTAEMPHLVVTIHVEPEAKAKAHGVPVL
jgi:cation diffusion facilitator family transporter